MALTGINISSDLTASSLFCCQNININTVLNTATGTNAFDTSTYVGVLAVYVNAANGASGTNGYVYLSSSADTNSLNSTNLGAGYNTTNFTNTSAGLQVLFYDTRGGAVPGKRYLYANSLFGGAGSNVCVDATVVGIKKYM